MGVTGLWRLIEGAGKEVSLESLEGKVFAVDASILLNQAIKGMKDQPNAHLHVLFLRLCKLLTYKIKPIFVFDGGVPVLKKQTIAARQKRKEEAAAQADSVVQRLKRTAIHQRAIDSVSGNSSQEPKSTTSHKPSSDLFELPPIPENYLKTEEDDYYELPIHDIIYSGDFDVTQVDVDNDAFLTLPAEFQHEILEELRDHTKHQISSTPLEQYDDADDFSLFQVAKVIKSSKLSQKIEGLRKQMITSMTNNAVEDGVHVLQANRVMSEDSTHYLLIKQDTQSQNLKNASRDPTSTDEQSKNDKKSSTFDFDKSNESSSNSISQSNTIQSVGQVISTEKSPVSEILPMSANEVVNENSERKKAHGANSKGKKAKHMTVPQSVVISDTDSSDETEISSFSQHGYLHSQLQREAALNKSTYEHESPLKLTVDDSSNEKIDNDTTLLAHLAANDLAADQQPVGLCNYNNANSQTKSVISIYNSSSSSSQTSTILTPITSINDEQLSSHVPHRNNESRLTTQDIVPCSTATAYASSLPLTVETTNAASDVALQNMKIHSVCPESSKKQNALSSASNHIATNIPLSSLDNAVSGINDNEMTHSISTQSEIAVPDTQGLVVNNKVMKITISASSKHEGDEMFPREMFLPSKTDTSDEADQKVTQKSRPTLDKYSDTNLSTLNTALNIERGNLYSQLQKHDAVASTVTKQMTDDAQELLRLFGVPYVVSPSEAEAQCAKLDELNLCDGVITDDSDVWLFGGIRVLKNFFQQDKCVLSYHRDDLMALFGMDRQKLIALALVCGSDYTDGIQGAGPVTALEIMAEFDSTNGINALKLFKEWMDTVKNSQYLPTSSSNTRVKDKLRKLTLPSDSFPNHVVIDAYLEPAVDDSTEKFEWGKPDLDLLRSYTLTKLNWPAKKVDDLICPVLKKLNSHETQKRLSSYFSILPTAINVSTDFHSKRLKTAISKIIGGDKNTPGDQLIPTTSAQNDVKSRKRPAKKSLKEAKSNQKQSKESKKPKRPVAVRIVKTEINLSEDSSDSN